MIDSLCQRYGCLPSALLAENADLLLRMHRILAEGRPEGEGESSVEEQLAAMSKAMPEGI